MVLQYACMIYVSVTAEFAASSSLSLLPRLAPFCPPQVQELLNDPTNSEWLDYSVEFCGGTHIQNTAAAESFVLLGAMSDA